MGEADTKLAAAALAIALVALFTALHQILQQYFMTADGYRRCHKSVMGEYARKTRLNWRWREFRFETIYTTPEILLVGDGAFMKHGQVLITGSHASRDKSLIPITSLGNDLQVVLSPTGNEAVIEVEYPGSGYKPGLMHPPDKKLARINRGEMACWLPLLHWIHEKTAMSLNSKQSAVDPESWSLSDLRLPAVVFQERSWDFQPPEVVRPLAKTSLSDIAVIARRMGMKWKDFRPSDGILLAEGHSQIITSTVVRSLGIVLQFQYSGQDLRLRAAEKNLRRRLEIGTILPEQEEIYIPRARADRLGCGVIRTDALLGLPDFTVSTQAEIVKALNVLDRTGVSSAALLQHLHSYPEFQFRVADLVALTSPPARFLGSSLIQVPAPSDNIYGVTTSSIGRRAFRLCLEEHIVVHHNSVGSQTLRALQICQDIGSKYAAWDHTDDYAVQEEQWCVRRDSKYMDLVHKQMLDLTHILNEMEQQYTFRYINLLGAHIRIAMFADSEFAGMDQHPVVTNVTPNYKSDVDTYFRLLPKIVDEMKKSGFHDRQIVIDAWVTMMLRAFCWGACHFFVPGERVPIQYFGSQLPVYIG